MFIVLIYFPAKLTIICRDKDFHLFIFPSANIIEGAEALSPGLLWIQAARPEGQKLIAQDCYGHKQHALKGQKLLAQVVMDTSSTP